MSRRLARFGLGLTVLGVPTTAAERALRPWFAVPVRTRTGQLLSHYRFQRSLSLD